MKIMRQPFVVILPHHLLPLTLILLAGASGLVPQAQHQHAPVVTADVVLGGDDVGAGEAGEGGGQERVVRGGAGGDGEAEWVGGVGKVLGGERWLVDWLVGLRKEDGGWEVGGEGRGRESIGERGKMGGRTSMTFLVRIGAEVALST